VNERAADEVREAQRLGDDALRGGEGEHLRDLARLGVRVEGLGVERLASPALGWHAALLAARLRADRIRILHAQDFFSDVLGALAARLAGVPYLVTRVDLAHALDAPRRWALAAASRGATRVVVNAVCIRDLCLRDGVAPDRVAVVRNGVDLAAFDAASARPPRDGALDAAGPWGDRVPVVDATHHGAWELPVLGEVSAPAAVLVRPDGYVWSIQA
jgi:hypothetical protein